jgi:hypothetical protein
MPQTRFVQQRIVATDGDALWFLGMPAGVKRAGEQTSVDSALAEAVFPRGAAPFLELSVQVAE